MGSRTLLFTIYNHSADARLHYVQLGSKIFKTPFDEVCTTCGEGG